MAGFTSPFITAIAKTISEEEGEFVGSGSFMVFAGQAFLVTAEHVATAARTGATLPPAFSNGNNTLYQLVTAGFFLDVPLDLALAPIQLEREPASTRRACPSSFISFHAGALNDFLFVHGFPGERSRFLAIGSGIFSTSLPYGAAPAIPGWRGFDPEKHFAVSYDPRFAEFSDQTPAELPSGWGMSGSAVWNTRRREVGDNWTPSDARVIGVVHRWDQSARCLIGTKIEHLHGFVARVWRPPSN